MSTQEINMAIATYFGWDSEKLRLLHSHGLDPSVPDYCNDLNAMHDAEKFLRPPYREDFSIWESYIECFEEDPHADARNRAVAFVSAIGKWKEEA